jgi:hypothetical protein
MNWTQENYRQNRYPNAWMLINKSIERIDLQSIWRQLDRIATTDKTRVHQYDPETKEMSKEWKYARPKSYWLHATNKIDDQRLLLFFVNRTSNQNCGNTSWKTYQNWVVFARQCTCLLHIVQTWPVGSIFKLKSVLIGWRSTSHRWWSRL